MTAAAPSDEVAPRGQQSARIRLSTPKHPGSRRDTVILVVLLGLTVLSSLATFGPFQPELIATFSLVMMLSLLFLRIPLAISMLFPSLLGMWAMRGPALPFDTLATLPYLQISSWSLGVVPMYLLLGLVISRTGIGSDLYRAVAGFAPRLPGNLAVASSVAGAGLSTVSGSTLTTVMAMTQIGVPEMLRAGYDRRYTVGSVMVAGLSGPLIPPSVLAIIYAGIAETPIGPQLLAGLLPGVLVVVVYILVIISMALIWPKLVGRTRGDAQVRTAATWAERGRLLRGAWVLPVVILIVFGGMFTGFFTATEAGACAALVAILAALPRFRKQGSMRPFLTAVAEVVSMTGAIFFLIIGAAAFSRLLTISGLGRVFVDFVGALGLDAVTFLLVLLVGYIVLGTFMDTLPMMLLTVPIMLPILNSLDISLLWFGVFTIIMAEMGMLTPPVGLLLYMTHRLAQNPVVNLGHRISLNDIIIAVCVIVPVAMLIVVALIFFPEIATFLPSLMSQ